MQHPQIPFLLLLLAVTSIARSETGSELLVRAGPVAVEIEERQAGQREINLPTLEVALSIEPRCESGKHVASVSVSVADTRRSFVGTDFEVDSLIETTLSLPERQLGPLILDRFCATDDDAIGHDRSIRIVDTFAINASLRCEDDTRQTMTYTTVGLEVELLCKPAENPPTAAEDIYQEPPLDPASRL